MEQSEILFEVVKLSQILEDIQLGLRPDLESDEEGLRDDLKALRERLNILSLALD